MKPNTRIYAFFDDVDVNDYMTPTDSSFNSTGNEGSELVTNSNGVFYGIFRLPNNESIRFNVGNKKFVLTDSPTNETEKGLFTTSAESEYSARGTSQVSQETVLSTRTAEVNFQNVTQRRTRTTRTQIQRPVRRRRQLGDGGGDGGAGDPIAQTFRIDDNALGAISGGAYLTKIDLYFSTKDSNLPVTVEIREVDAATQYVTNKVVPFSRVTLPPSSVNTSSDGSAATEFTFPSPVYLQSGIDYAYVVKPAGGNPNYNVYVARLGDVDIITGNRVVKNPYSGVLFASSNDKTWTSIQNEDMKFAAYFAQFKTSSGTAFFQNEDKDYYTIANVSSAFDIVGESVHGETTLNLGSTISANIGEFAGGDTSNANGEVTLATGSTLRVKDVTLDDKYTNGENITLYFANGTPTGESATLSSQSTPTGSVDYYDAVTSANVQLHLTEVSSAFTANTFVKSQSNGKSARIVSIDNIRVDVVDPLKGKIIPEGTSTELVGKFAETSSSLQSSFKSLTDNENNYTRTARYILSRSNEINNLSGQKSAQLKMTLNSSNDYTSPAVDLKRTSLITVENLVNNDTTGEEDSEGGNASAKYITRTVTLADGQDAEDIQVYIATYKPSSADVKIYYKILNAEDSDTLEDVNWKPMTLDTINDTTSDSEDTEDFKELEYSIPDSEMTGGNGEVQYVNSNGVTFTGFKQFKIKVLLLSTNPPNPPRIQDFRALALSV
ncbi:hypothetical protein [Methanohalobium sp.]|uniref:hypothetical protein n=1 Tax=Methanohalobium sp. TaxID=2837493 RepID=UPI0025DF9CF0|nr:hypothetical protein [Methanohalobium sp.]